MRSPITATSMRRTTSAITRILILCGLAGLLSTSSGCLLCSFLPATIDTELSIKAPLRGSAKEIHTIAVVPPSRLETLFVLPDASRGKLDKVGLELSEHLQQSGKLSIASPVLYDAALSEQRRGTDVRITGAPSETERNAAILKAARAVNADAVLLLNGKWESAVSLGDQMCGRQEFKRFLSVTLVDARSGETVWYQEAIAIIHEGMVIPLEPEIREAVVSEVTKNLLQTMR